MRTAEIPAAVSDVVLSRLSALPAPTRRIVGVAAVIGRDFDAVLLAAVTDNDVDDILDRLDPALATGLVIERDAGQFQFSHALVRDAVSNSLRPRGAPCGTPTSPPPSTAGRAWISTRTIGGRPALAGRRSTTCRHGVAGGRRSGRGSHGAAGMGGGRRACWPRRCRRANWTRQRPNGIATTCRCCWRTRAGGRVTGRARTRRCGRRSPTRSEWARSNWSPGPRSAAWKAARGFPAATPRSTPIASDTLRNILRQVAFSDSEVRCRVMLALAGELYYADAPQEIEALTEQGLAMARRIDDAALLVWATTAAYQATWKPSTAELRYRWMTEALAAAIATGDARAEAVSRFLLAGAAQETGRIDEMREHLESSRSLALQYRLATVEVALGWLEAPWLALQGGFQQAYDLIAQTARTMNKTSMNQQSEALAGTA